MGPKPGPRSFSVIGGLLLSVMTPTDTVGRLGPYARRESERRRNRGDTGVDLHLVEWRCGKVAVTLGSQETDEIVLLRTASKLRRIHAELRQAARTEAVSAGYSERLCQIEALLDEIEHELLSVLLGHHTLSPQQMRIHLTCALDRSFDALDMLRDTRHG
jgi:hypothetical protein